MRIKVLKILQFINDYRAMEIFRKHMGDMELIAVANGSKNGGKIYNCRIFQNEWFESDEDPSRAIIKAFNRWKDKV